MRQTPRCSVVIPVYNGEKYLAAALDSALCQTMRELEIIAVDDASTDASRELLGQYAKKDPRVRLVLLPQNGGVCGARNSGVEAAQGEWVAFLDCDDVWLPEKLETQFACLQKQTDTVLCYTGALFFAEDGNEKYVGVPETVSADALLNGNVIITSSVVAKRAALQRFAMERPDLHEDFICWHRILQAYGPAVGVDEPLLRYRLTPGSKSRKKLHSAYMTWRTYRYMGLSVRCTLPRFFRYAMQGIRRYWK